MVRSPYLKKVDSSEFEARFSSDRAIKYSEILSSDISFKEIEEVFLDRLPKRELDLINLYRRAGKNQKDIAKIFGVTQGAISSRLKRAHQRLQFLRDLPKITEEEIDQGLAPYFDPLEMEIIKAMVRTTCQSETAKIVNTRFSIVDEKKRMTQVKVRHRFEKCISKLEELSKSKSELRKFHDLLVFIRKNPYMLHEVKLPHFDRGVRAVYSFNP